MKREAAVHFFIIFNESPIQMSKKALFIFTLAALSLAAGSQANAVQIREGAIACITQRYLEKHAQYIASNNPDFAADLHDRAACFEKKTLEDVVV